mmetsp:Transcript_5897/g.10121  ORF Transcript_5897/g.10121 Transcript_5897/m.10121 type:complete len:104 (+) Transcript_5897:223-534(+)
MPGIAAIMPMPPAMLACSAWACAAGVAAAPAGVAEAAGEVAEAGAVEDVAAVAWAGAGCGDGVSAGCEGDALDAAVWAGAAAGGTTACGGPELFATAPCVTPG